MALTVITGPAGNVQQETEVYGAQSSGYTGATKMHSQKLINFRVGNRPVTMKLKTTIDIGNGDAVTVVGSERKGIVNALVVRNDVTGVVYSHSPLMLIVLGGVLALGGIMSLGILIGFVMLPLGAYVVYKGLQTKRALGMLRAAAPAPLDHGGVAQ